MENLELNTFHHHHRSSTAKRPSVQQSTTCGGSLCIPDNQMQLLTALKNRHFITFQKIINSSAIDINYCYDYPDYKTLLEIACCEHTLEFIDLLLQKGANPNLINPNHKRAALHFAIERADVEIVKRLLKVPNIDVNILSNGNSPLVKAVKQIEEDEDNKDKYIEIVELLIKANADVNIPDTKGQTAIYIAAKNKYYKIVELILEQASKVFVDIDYYKDRSGKSARDLIHNAGYSKPLPEYNDKREIIVKREVSQLCILLSQCKEEEFIESLKNFINASGESVVDLDNGLYTLLQLACEKGLEKCVKKLLHKGADVNKTNPNNEETPIEIVCRQGFHSILKNLLHHEKIRIPSILLHIVLQNVNNKIQNPKTDYTICLDLLLHDERINVNMTDHKNNTALHYAARYGNTDAILQLLRAGACVSIRNKFNEPPLSDISPAVFNEFLNECLTTNDERCTDENYEIIFNYDFLVPPSNNVKCFDNQCSIPIGDESELRNNNETVYLAPETDALLYMTKNSELRPLLKHPVLRSFLFLKWQRISHVFFLNLALYLIFCVFLYLYILTGNIHQSNNTEESDTILNVLSGFLLIGCVLLTIRELFQLLVSPRLYVKNVENFIEIFLLFTTYYIIFHKPSEHGREQLSVIAILLSAGELILLIGRHPKLSTYIEMLLTVSWNFLKFLCWYSILILAFALSFHTLFKENKHEENQINNKTEILAGKENADKNGGDGDEPNFFVDPGLSLLKTIIMLTGEFEAGSIDFNVFPVTSHMVFVAFVFLIAIVLFNLLNGLAVSDTQMIKNDAELVSYVSRIKLIAYFENMILGELPPLGKLIQNFCCCTTNTNICLRPIAKRVCLFPHYLPLHKISIKPNQGCKIVYKTEKQLNEPYSVTDEEKQRHCDVSDCINSFTMDSKVVKDAKIVIMEKHSKSEFELLQESLACLQRQILQCDQKIQKQDEQMDEIVKILLNINNSLVKNKENENI